MRVVRQKQEKLFELRRFSSRLKDTLEEHEVNPETAHWIGSQELREWRKNLGSRIKGQPSKSRTLSRHSLHSSDV
jgi:hypothetical protein